jgi:hypothetical protein
MALTCRWAERTNDCQLCAGLYENLVLVHVPPVLHVGQAFAYI